MVVDCSYKQTWWSIAAINKHGGRLQRSINMVVDYSDKQTWWSIATINKHGGRLQR
jgi:hypothetical protein